MMHPEVIRFACSLDDSRVVLDMVFETIHKCFEDKPISFSVNDTILYMQFLKSLCEEQSTVMETNPLVGIYVDYVVREESPVFTLCSMNMEMSRNDIKLLSDAADKGCLGNLKYLDLSGNTLTDLIEYLVSGEDQDGFRSLEILDVSNTGLSTADVKSLFTALHKGKFPKLIELNFLTAPLTDCLSVIFQAVDHPAFPFSKQLMLQGSSITKDDIKCIHKTLCDRKLQDLVEINLSYNKLTDCMTELLGKDDHFIFETLRSFDLSHTELSTMDVKILFIAFHQEKFPNLRKFHFLPAPIYDCLSHIIQVVDHPAFPFPKCPEEGEFHVLLHQYFKMTFPSRGDVYAILDMARQSKLLRLRHLDLKRSRRDHDLHKFIIGRDEICNLSEIVASRKLPDLKSFVLSRNILTNLMEIIMRPSYPDLQQLKIEEAMLSKCDLSSLTDAILVNHLPKLRGLSLSNNIINGAESEWLNLVESLLLMYKGKTLNLHLWNVGISVALSKTLLLLCKHTNVRLSLTAGIDIN